MRFGSWFRSSRNNKAKQNQIELKAPTMPHFPTTYDKTPSMATTTEVVRPRSSHQSKNRRSWFGGRPEAHDEIEALPPMPPMPSTMTQSQPQRTSTIPADNRRSRAASIKSVKRSNSTKRQSFWASSNPDDSDSDVPPVPALVRGGSKDSLDTLGSVGPMPAQNTRPVSTALPRKKYVPRSAEKSFLVTTSGASEDKRKSYRRSFKLDEDADLVCLTEEQQIEWAKLMNLRGVSENQVANQVHSPIDGRAKYANKQALAALEFGPMR